MKGGNMPKQTQDLKEGDNIKFMLTCFGASFGITALLTGALIGVSYIILYLTR